MKLFKRLRLISRKLNILIHLRLYPHIFFTFNPFKIYEFEELKRGITFSKDDVILDLGCGHGLHTLLLAEKCKKAIGTDISEECIKFAKLLSHYMRGAIDTEFYCAKLQEARFEDEFFDKIYCACVLEHVPDYVEVLREAHRILKKDGQMIFSVDSLEAIEDKEAIEKHKKEHFVENYFSSEELQKLLEEINFKKITIYPIFRSDFARNLFIKGINNEFHYGRLPSLLAYILLRYKESHCAEKDKGIFLIVKCSK